MLDKGDLGIGYLLGTGLGLTASAGGYLLLVDKSVLTYWLGVILTAGLGITLSFVGLWLWRGDLPGKHVWKVAIWGALGFTLPTLLGVLITVLKLHPELKPMFKSLFIVFIATGGVVGVLVGSVLQLSEEHSTTRSLAQRMSVLNRVLRHNIRNDMNLILGYAQRLRDGNEPRSKIADRIESTSMRIVELSNSIRRISDLEVEARKPVNVATVIEERVESVRSSFPEASITTDLPEAAWVEADSLLPVAVENLIHNAIIHNDSSQPNVELSVTEPAETNGHIEIRVMDDGPGIPNDELAVLDDGPETALDHGSGIGLWLVKWFVDTHNGDLRFETADPRGTKVVLRLPLTDPP